MVDLMKIVSIVIFIMPWVLLILLQVFGGKVSYETKGLRGHWEDYKKLKKGGV